jgi:4-amino-4-deoxy-L-arabinose transferase-like glycosyltransferase
MNTDPTQDALTPSGEGSFKALERYGLIVAFSLYVVVQVNASLHHGSWGQDFLAHKIYIDRALSDPWRFLTTYTADRTNPPLYHLLGALVYKMTGGVHALEVIALASAVVNAGALFLLYLTTRRLIHSPVMRLACTIFVLFLPCALIHAVVLASDALATPLFLCSLYLFTLLTEDPPPRRFWAIMGGLCVLMLLGLLTKFTFASLAPVSAVLLFGCWRSGSLGWRRLVGGLMLVSVIPGALAYLEYKQYSAQGGCQHSLQPEAQLSTGAGSFKLRSLLFFRWADFHLLSAPPYNEAPDGAHALDYAASVSQVPNLLLANKFSYPGLLHLATFTDILNIYQYDPDDGYFGARSRENAARMSLAVKTAFPFTLFALVAVPFLMARGTWSVLVKKDRQWLALLLISLPGAVLFLNVVAFLPLLPYAYYHGYWLPRLIVPALLIFVVIAFVGLEHVIDGRWRAGRWICLVLVCLQSALHVLFLWPWGVMKS